MPRSTDPSKYPGDFFTLLDRASIAPVRIPDESPHGLRGYIQAFFRACEQGDPDSPLVNKAKGLQATCPRPDPAGADPAERVPHVLVCRREASAYATRVRAALTAPAKEAP